MDYWSNIRVFLAVGKAGSTLAAAKELGTSQATVARRIAALEQAVAVALFFRDTRGSHLTEDGRALADAAEAFVSAAASFDAAAEELARKSAEVIRIAAPGPIFSKNFSAILAEFATSNPGSDFHLIPSDQALDVGAGDVDIAFLFTHQIENETLIVRKLGVERTTFFASEQYVALNGLPRTPDDWRGQAIVGVTGPKLPEQVANWIAERATAGAVSTRCENIASLVAAIQMGRGIGPLPVTLGDGVEGLVRCFDPPEALDIPIWLAINQTAYTRKIIKSLVSFLAPRLAAHLRK